MRTVRLFIFSLLLFLVISQLRDGALSPRVQFLFNLFLMIEIFFHYKISRALPSRPLAKNKGENIFQSFTLPALYGFVSFPKVETIIKHLLETPQVQLFLQKTNISRSEIQLLDIVAPDYLAKKAFETATYYRHTFVTTLDVFLAYLLLTEEKTRLLFNKNIKNEAIDTVIFWLRQEFIQEELPHKTRVKLEGSGIGEALVTGWTYETKKYTNNFTYYALSEEPVILGREQDFKTLLEGLVKIENNNILLVGDIGSGKENLIRSLAYESFEGHLGSLLSHRRVYELLAGPLTAGISSRSDLEVRLQDIIAEISHSHDVILYIPDFQNIVGGTSYNLDLSGALLPYLKAGNMPVVATMTVGAYKTYMEHNPLKEAFNVITLKPPEKQLAIQMILFAAKKIEKKYWVVLSYAAIATAVDLANRFLQDSALPGSAISLLETVANSVSLSPDAKYFDNTRKKMVEDTHIIKQVEATTNVPIGKPSAGEADLLLHLEEKLHQRVIEQDDAIRAIAEAMRRVRSGMKIADRPISFLFLGPTGVGKTETAKALADLYYGGEKHMIRLDMSEYTDEAGLKRLLGAPPGEGDERGELTDKVHDNPSSLILLDEFEKAHPQVHNLFLQVLDDGRLTDNKGVTVSFSNSIIIATSNAGSEFIREEVEKGTVIDKVFDHRLLDYLQTKAIFKPELLNRFDEVVTFKPLDEKAINQVIGLMISSLTKSLSEQDIRLVLDEKVMAKIAKEGFDREFGARPLRRYLQDTIEDMIAQKKLTNEIARGNTVTVTTDASGNLQLTVS